MTTSRSAAAHELPHEQQWPDDSHGRYNGGRDVSVVMPMEQDSPGYQLFMLALCLFALVILVLPVLLPMDPEVAAILQWADTVVCLVFFGDFVRSLLRAPSRRQYLLTWGWLDLLSSIPALDVARWGRVGRMLRLVRVLRALRASRVLGKVLLRHRGHSVALAAAALALFLIVGSSAAVLYVEDPRNSTIKTGGDAVWWAFTTITTVGYGDRYPVTAEGRVIAAVLMTAGVGLFSAFSAALAAWFLKPEDEATDRELTALRSEIAALRKLIEQRLPEQG